MNQLGLVMQDPVDEELVQKLFPEPKPRKPWNVYKAMAHVIPSLERHLSDEDTGDDEVYEIYMRRKTRFI